MANDKAKRTTISISIETKDALDSIKHTGQKAYFWNMMEYDKDVEDMVRNKITGGEQ